MSVRDPIKERLNFLNQQLLQMENDNVAKSVESERRRKIKAGIPMDPRDPRAKRTISPQVARPVKTEPQTPEEFLFRTGPARIQQRRFAPAPFEMKPAHDAGVLKSVIHPFADDVALDDENEEGDLVGIISDFTQTPKSTHYRETLKLPGEKHDDIKTEPSTSNGVVNPFCVADQLAAFMRPKMTIPSELAIKPEELDLELNEYNQEPFAQHLIVNVQGYYCKVCDMFFCEDEEPKKRHSSSRTHYEQVARRLRAGNNRSSPPEGPSGGPIIPSAEVKQEPNEPYLPPPPVFTPREPPQLSPTKPMRPAKRDWTPDDFIPRMPPQPMAQNFQRPTPRGPHSVNGEPVAPPVSIKYSATNLPPRQFGPRPPGARAVRPRSDSYVRNGGFKRANFDNLRILTYEDIQKNMELRGMQADAEKEILLQRLDVLLQLESRNRNARGYFLTQIFEKNVQGHKFEWLQKDELEKILLEIQGVVAVINIQRREENNEVVWFVVMLTTFPMSQEIIAPEPLVRRYQSIPLRICPYKNLLALNDPPKKQMTAVNRHFTPKADCNYVAVD